MNRRWINFLTVTVLVFLFPVILYAAVPPREDRNRENSEQPSEHTNSTTVSTQVKADEDEALYVSVLMQNGDVELMQLNEYVTGVVLAEMPASFEFEALKAQAVVARTYTLRRQQGNAKHPLAPVCTDPSCCQGYCSAENYLGNGGNTEDLNKIQKAVNDTENMVLMFNGALIEATYFSCSGGSTEDAAAVWGVDVPYLQATPSPGEEGAAHYADTECFTAAEFKTLLGRELKGDPSTWFGKVTYTDGHGVDTIEIGGKRYEGSKIRKLLGLRSTAFSVAAFADTVVITTRGYGHRVGMSQYGADAMALQGNDFQQILSHYYTGAQLVSYGN